MERKQSMQSFVFESISRRASTISSPGKAGQSLSESAHANGVLWSLLRPSTKPISFFF